MAEIFIRVELRGEPTGDVYDELHEYMEDENNWSRTIDSSEGVIDLPTAMYHGNSNMELLELVEALQDYIESNIWDDAVVMAIETGEWALSGG